jgi:hypothetical protein
MKNGIRRTALLARIPYYTTVPGAVAAIEGSSPIGAAS